MAESTQRDHDDDPLEAWEGRVWQETHKEQADWDSLVGAIRTDDRLNTQPPRLAPVTERRSSAELLYLIDAFAGSSQSLHTHWVFVAEDPDINVKKRAGYLLIGKPSEKEALVFPSFARSISSGNPSGDDIWAVDQVVVASLGTIPRRVALAWLESPGRRLIRDLNLLGRAPSEQRWGATDLSLRRIYRAAGATDRPSSTDWAELHDAIPGQAMLRWQPASQSDPSGKVVTALRFLDQGSPLMVRGAALSWLLNRAADKPFYEIEEQKYDLRQVLAAQLATALPFNGTREGATISELELAALRHASRITENDPEPARLVEKTWHVARWLQGCLILSPFFGGDEQALTARLTALLPEASLVPTEATDALHPLRFGDDGIDLAEMALMAGVVSHFLRKYGETVSLPPNALIKALRKVASRSLRDGERNAEAALAHGHNELTWPAPHVAPPLVARWLMTDQRIGWMTKVSDAAIEESLDLLEKYPARHGWVAFAIHAEGRELKDDIKGDAVQVWNNLLSPADESLPAHALASMAAGLIDVLDDAEANMAVELAASAETQWRPFVLGTLVEALHRVEREKIWRQVVERLRLLVADHELDAQVRLNAALIAVRNVSASKFAGRDELLRSLVEVMTGGLFATHTGLRRELRRLGYELPTSNRGGRP
jgi:hypothetical protein